MKRKGIITKGLAGVLAISMLLTGCGGKSGKDNKDMKDLVYKSEKLSCTDDMKGDISNFTVAGDKIYVYTTEWVPGPGNTEDAEAEEEAYEAKDQEETADGDAAVMSSLTAQTEQMPSLKKEKKSRLMTQRQQMVQMRRSVIQRMRQMMYRTIIMVQPISTSTPVRQTDLTCRRFRWMWKRMIITG